MPQAAETKLTLPNIQRTLHRYPARKLETLRAWDAADELLLLDSLDKISLGQRVLILNDGFGSLAATLAQYNPGWSNDSYISHQACLNNLHNNNIAPSSVDFLPYLSWGEKKFDWVIIKIPKSHAQLEDQLYRLKDCLHSGSQIIAAAMCKNMHSQTIKLFEKIHGPSHTSLAKKKLACFIASPVNTILIQRPTPSTINSRSYSGALPIMRPFFSQQKLDIGTAFFLDNFPEHLACQSIIDLACGNGILGLRAAKAYPQASIEFYDESYSAIASAKLNAEKNFTGRQGFSFIQGNCLDQAKPNSCDLIVNNPPFHQQHSISSHIAKQMFRQAFKVLRKGGEFWLVANRHLGYHKDLQSIFGNFSNVASNSKFVILKAQKTR